MKIQTSLISVSDKTGLVTFATALKRFGIEILSTGGTAELLQKNSIPVMKISDYTGAAEILDGRVKTLHPKIAAGVLAQRSKATHRAELANQKIKPIDLVVVNLYPFEETVNRQAPLAEVVENIDIGGPTLIRAAAKNFPDVGVVVDPADYPKVIEEMEKNKGGLSEKVLLELAAKAFEHVARYDILINSYFNRLCVHPFPEFLNLTFTKIQNLRYGENPHQLAAFYREPKESESSISTAKQIQGKELSFNNIADADAALEIVKEFERPAVAIIKHTNPCGAACGKTLEDAFVAAYETDRESAFGGIIGLNKQCDVATAKRISEFFVDVVIAPGFDAAASRLLSKKKNLRLLEVGLLKKPKDGLDLRRVTGGLLVQTGSHPNLRELLNIVTKKKPTASELKGMVFAATLVKHIRSNGIVIAQGEKTVGIGAGQMARVDSVKLAVEEASEKCKGAVLASDGFFPFPDSVEVAHAAGIAAIVQPGGSIKDEEIIRRANELGVCMAVTGVRLFKH